MKELNKWVDVRKKQVREVENMTVTIIKDSKLQSYITLKEINKISKNDKGLVNGKWIIKLNKGFTMIEYSPIILLDDADELKMHLILEQ